MSNGRFSLPPNSEYFQGRKLHQGKENKDETIHSLFAAQILTLFPNNIAICGLVNNSQIKYQICTNTEVPWSFSSDLTSWKEHKTPYYSIKVGNRFQQTIRHVLIHGYSDDESKDTSYIYLVNTDREWNVSQYPIIDSILRRIHAEMIAMLDLDQDAPTPYLTKREIEILQWCYSGKTNPEIAQILNISRSTVKNHIYNIFAKLDVSNKTQAVVKAINLGLSFSLHSSRDQVAL